MSDLREFFNLEHRGDVSVLLMYGKEWIIGPNCQIDQRYGDPRDVVTRWTLSLDLYHVPPPMPVPPPLKRKWARAMGLRRPK